MTDHRVQFIGRKILGLWTHQGFALPFVLGAIAVFVPLLVLYSMLGGSQTRQAVHFHKRLTTETIAWAGIQAGIGRLQNDGGPQFFSGNLSGGHFSVSIQPLGTGMASQSIYNVFSSSQRGRFTYTFLVKCEQFPRDPAQPALPNLVIPRDFWGTSEPYDISQAMDCNALINLRGSDVMAWLGTIDFELDNSDGAYLAAMNAKTPSLPPEIKTHWSTICQNLIQEKAGVVQP